MKQRFNSFSELSCEKTEGKDYAITVQEIAGSKVAIIAPHGGSIEPKTLEIAQKVAANDYHFYAFEGLASNSSYFDLHVESHHFDEPRCIELVKKTDTTLTIHGCQGREPVIYLGGKDEKQKRSLADAFNKAGIKALTTGHIYKGTHPQNICNRNRQKKGVQLEFSRGLRDNPTLVDKCVTILRAELKSLLNP